MSLAAILEAFLLGVTIRLVNACAKLVPILLHVRDRRIGLVPPSQSTFPNKVVSIPSSVDPQRQIKLHIHVPSSFFTKNRKAPYPTYIHFHGAGFCVPLHGTGREQCTYLAEQLDCIVVDADYAKAPEHPYPACHEDALDVLRYVASQEDLFDKQKVTIGGQSSGANIALVAATQKGQGIPDIKSVICWYPATDMSTRGDLMMRSALGSWLHKSMRRAYLPPDQVKDLKNPRISPYFSPSEAFPPTLFIVGDRDALLRDSVELADRLRTDGRDCEIMVVSGADHAWEATPLQPDTSLGKARKNAYALVEKRLKEAFDGKL